MPLDRTKQMGRLSIWAGLLAACSLAALIASAAPAWAAERDLTLEEALELANTRNASLASARTRVDAASASVRQAWASVLPQLTGQGKYTHNYREIAFDLSQQTRLSQAQVRATQGAVDDIYARIGATPPAAVAADLNELRAAAMAPAGPSGPIIIQKQEQLDAALTLVVPLVVPAAYPAISAAKGARTSAEANFMAQRAAILYSAAQAFFVAAGADEIVLARKSAIEVAKQTLKDATNRVQAGAANAVEQQRAELAMVRAEQALDDAVYARDQSYRALATIIELHEPFRVHPLEAVAKGGQMAPLGNDQVEYALKLRPEVIALEKGLDADRSQVTSYALKWAPTLSGFGNVRAFNYPGFAGDQYAWAVGVQLDWVLYDGGVRDAQRNLASSVVRDEEARLRLLKQTVSDEVANAHQALGTRDRALLAAERGVKLATKTLELVRVQQSAGAATQLDLLTAQDSLVASELAVAQARFELSLAQLTLERVSGRFPKPTQL